MMRVLDLFCGAGGATRGLQLAGFRVTGVDIKPQPNYCGDEFIRADAAEFHLWGYDLIWASPPCQRFSCVTPNGHREKYPDLIAKMRQRLQGKNYVIENVPGARHLLKNPVMLCGSMFGLRTRRHRYFETSFPVEAPGRCDHSKPPLLVTTAGANSRKIGNTKSTKNAPEAYGIDWMRGRELAEAIPPAYSRYIAEQLGRGSTRREGSTE